MSHTRKRMPGTIAALDEGIELVTQLPPFLAFLWLTALPSRFLFAAFLVELAFWALSFTVLVPLAMVAAAALAAVAAPQGGPGLLSALREMAAGSGRFLSWGLYLVFFLVALLLAAFNLHLVFSLSVWLLGSVAPVDAPVWGHLVGFENPLYLGVLGVGATLLVEPFWLATITVHVAHVRARASGEDLRQAFEEIRRQAQRDAA